MGAVKKVFRGKGTPIGDQKFSINEAVGEVKRVFGGKGQLVGGQKGIRTAPPVATMGKGVRGRPRTRGIMPVMGHESGDMILTQKGEIDPTISSRDGAIEYKGGDIFGDISKAFKKVGTTINKTVIKPAGQYITAKKGGLALDLIDYGIPAATAAIVGGIAGATTGGVGGVAGSAIGSKLGKEVIAPEIRKLTGSGMRGGMCCGGALMPAGYDGAGNPIQKGAKAIVRFGDDAKDLFGLGLMPAGMGLMPAGMGLKPAGAGVYMPAGRTIVRHGKGVRARVMVPKKITVEGGAMLMPRTSSAGTGDYVPMMIDTPAFYTPLM